jgi:hypothetical protein
MSETISCGTTQTARSNHATRKPDKSSLPAVGKGAVTFASSVFSFFLSHHLSSTALVTSPLGKGEAAWRIDRAVLGKGLTAKARARRYLSLLAASSKSLSCHSFCELEACTQCAGQRGSENVAAQERKEQVKGTVLISLGRAPSTLTWKNPLPR